MAKAGPPHNKKQVLGLPVLPSVTQVAYEDLLHFFKASPDLLCIADYSGNCKPLKRAWQVVLGWESDELYARKFVDLVRSDDRVATLARMAKCPSGASTVSFENRFLCKDGEWKRLEWTASHRPDSPLPYAVGRDLTKRIIMGNEIVRSLDRERERMGRELPDGRCQNLAAVAVLSTSLARRLTDAAPSESAAAREIGTLLGRSIQEARDLAGGLDPAPARMMGLADALADFCSRTAAAFEITCGFRCEPRGRSLNAHRETELLRIAPESVNKAIAHGRAQWIEMILSFDDCQGTLAIHDDGIGICASSGRHYGMGLHPMACRAHRIGGSLQINRRSPRGTSVTCVFRVPSAKS